MGAGEELREGMEIMVRVRVGKVYDPPNPAVVTLVLSPRCPKILAHSDDIAWLPLDVCKLT